MLLDDITPLILTRDEEANIGRTLQQLTWAKEVLVLDSFSADKTLEIASLSPNVRILQRAMDTLAGQSNYGVGQVRTPWLLLMDADYFVPADLTEELRQLDPPAGVSAYRARFTYLVNGRPLRASLYPPRPVLLRRDHVEVWQDGHAHRTRVDGEIGDLATAILHDDRKTFRRFVERQKLYMRQEAEKLRHSDFRALNLAGRIRRLIVVAPVAVLLHTLFVRGLILDGLPGLRYAYERFVAELVLSVELLRVRKF